MAKGPSRMAMKKPLIGAISGYAVAGGFELALLCDLRVVEENAVMGVFCRRFGKYFIQYTYFTSHIAWVLLGVPLIDGGTVRLPAIVGFSRAMDLILTGRPIKAKEAFDWGLANRVVSCGTGTIIDNFSKKLFNCYVILLALGQAVNLADSLKKFPQKCMLADRKSAYYATYSAKSLDDALSYEHNNGAPILQEVSTLKVSLLL